MRARLAAMCLSSSRIEVSQSSSCCFQSIRLPEPPSPSEPTWIEIVPMDSSASASIRRSKPRQAPQGVQVCLTQAEGLSFRKPRLLDNKVKLVASQDKFPI